jgi:prepilin-type N-terminal cleavage/methylation domain-containing protein
MRGSPKNVTGVTLIELMVTVVVLAILVALAIPSFVDFRERVAVRGAGDQLVSFFANAKLEALKRDRAITVNIVKSGTNMCIGATTVAAGCDCFENTDPTKICDVARYPASAGGADQSEWRGVTMVGKPTLGPTDTDDVGLATIDPKRGYLTDGTDVGGTTIQSSAGHFRLRLYVDRWARPYLCAPTDSPRILSDYATRTCAP